MLTELSANALRLYGKQTPLGNRQSRGVASRSIGRVPRRIEWDKHIVAVVAAGDKYANQCPVADTAVLTAERRSGGNCPLIISAFSASTSPSGSPASGWKPEKSKEVPLGLNG